MNRILIAAIVAAVCFVSCKRGQQAAGSAPKGPGTPTTTSLQVLDASAEKISTGIPGGPSGTEYYFTVVVPDAEVSFDSLWFNNKATPLYVARKSAGITSAPEAFAAGDTLTVRASDITTASGSRSTVASPPKPYDGAALFGYTLHKQQQLLPISEFATRPAINRPTTH